MHIKTIKGRDYAYNSIRRGDRFTSECLGSDPSFAPLIEICREKAEEKREHREAGRLRMMEIIESDKLTLEADRTLTLAADSMIEAAGFYRHYRGSWRRRHPMRAVIGPRSCGNALATKSKATDFVRRAKANEKGVPDEWTALVKRVDGGDENAADLFREIVRQDFDALKELIQLLVDRPQRTVLEGAATNSPSVQNMLAVCLERMTRELEGANPSAIEWILAARVALCWISAYRADIMEAAENNERQDLAMARLRMKRAESMQRRLLAALKALAEVRKLPIAAIQVNVNQGQTAAK